MSNKNVQLDDILRLLSDVKTEDVQKERAKLEVEQKINFVRLDDALDEILLKAKEPKPAWILAAANKRAKLQGLIEKSKDRINLSKTEIQRILEEIQLGKHGSLPQQQFSIQFRNKKNNEITEEELINFLRDQALLRIISESNDD